MNTLGIIASKQERIARLEWYEFWKRNKPDYLTFEAFGICFAIAYDNQNVGKLFARHQIQKAVYSEQALKVETGSTIIETGEALYNRLVPSAICKLLELDVLNKEESRLAIFCDRWEPAAQLIQHLHSSFRYVTFVCESEESRLRLAELAMDRYGLALLLQDGKRHVVCDVAVLLSSATPNIPKNAILIDQYLAHNSTGKYKTINNFGVRLEPRLPFPVSSLAICEAMYPGTLPKINAFLLDLTPVSLEGLLP